VYYTGPKTPSGGTTIRISRFDVSADPNVANPTETRVLTIDHPGATNHDGGQLQFGPDGYLYIGVGDGGSEGDPSNNGQNTQVLLGKLLRINVTGVPTYTVPASNPFTQTASGLPEIWAYGLRNPWRFSFDHLTGELYIADVGQDSYEEVDFQEPGVGGRNYGWKCYEGFHVFNLTHCAGITNFVPPVTEYSHSSGAGEAIIGGYVYRGQQYPSLFGYYFFSDWVSGNVWAMQACTWQVTLLGHLINTPSLFAPSTFGQDNFGQLYIADLNGGHIYKLVGPAAYSAPLAPASGTPTYLPLIIRQPPLCS
jgi:glucose/arabinose dehydrogenase